MRPETINVNLHQLKDLFNFCVQKIPKVAKNRELGSRRQPVFLYCQKTFLKLGTSSACLLIILPSAFGSQLARLNEFIAADACLL